VRVVPASVAALLLLAACSRAGEEESGKRAPIAPPPAAIDIPQGLNIPVEVDGQAAPAITRATLAGLEPDFADQERRAWRLSRILPSFTGPAVVEAVGRVELWMAFPACVLILVAMFVHLFRTVVAPASAETSTPGPVVRG